jgi:hypothetical protein
VPPAGHHTVLTAGNLDAGLRFDRDGLGLEILQDGRVKGG